MKFRQKIFSKSKALRYLANHPVLPLSAASLGVGLANYRTNTRRQKEGVKQHKEQLDAFNKLSENITKNSEALNRLDTALNNSSNLIKLNQKSTSEPKKRKRRFLLFSEKNYSIESGGFKGRKIEPSPSSVSSGALVGAGLGAATGAILSNSSAGNAGIGGLIGAGIGAGLGALAVWMNNIAEKSIFNRGLSRRANSYTLCRYLENYYMKPEETEERIETRSNKVGDTRITNIRKTSKTRPTIDPRGTLYNIDSDPNKHVVNILLRGNVMVMLINKATSFEIKKLNTLLDKYCSSYKMADYSSEKLGKDIYLVEINVVENTEGIFVINLIDAGFKVNILTTDRFGIKNK